MALIVAEKDRAAALAFVFLGWSLAIAVGLPLITLLATQFGWRATYFSIGIVAGVSALLNAAALPSGLRGHPLSLKSFADIARNRTLLLILLITLFQMSGQFAITVYMAALLQKVADGGPAAAGLLFTLLGAAGLIGNLAATRMVQFSGVQRTLGFFIVVMMSGALVFALGSGILALMAAGVFILGLWHHRRKFDAAGAAGDGGAGARERDGRAQYLVSVCRTGDRLRCGGLSVSARVLPDHRIPGVRVFPVGVRDLRDDERSPDDD